MKWVAMNLQSIFHFAKEKQTIQAKKGKVGGNVNSSRTPKIVIIVLTTRLKWVLQAKERREK